MIGKVLKPDLPPHFIERKRLLSKFRKNKRFVFVSGKAGSGKTVLVSSVIDGRNLWLTLDNEDNDFTTFLNALFLSLKKNLKVNVPTREILKSSNPFSICLNTILNILEKQKKIYVVFDNLHSISDKSKTLSFIERLFIYSPKNIKFIFTSRESTIPSFLIRFIDYGEIIDEKEMKFNLEEIEELLDKLRLDRKDAKWLSEFTDGWAMGVVLGAYSIKEKDREWEERTFKFLLREVFDNLEERYKDFLLKTSIFDVINIDEVNEFLKIKNSEEILNNLMKKGIFLVKSGNNYFYHKLFREFLNYMAKGRKDIEKLKRDLITYYLSKNKKRKALKISLELKDKEKLKEILKSISPYEAIFYPELVVRAIENFKIDTEDTHLVELLGTIHFLRGENHKAYALYEKFKDKFRGNEYFLNLLKWRLLVERGDYSKVIEEYEKLKEKMDKFPKELYIDLMYFVVESYYYMGRKNLSEKIIEKLYHEIKEMKEDIVRYSKILNAYCIIKYHNKGKLTEAKRIYEEILSRGEIFNVATSPLILTNLALVEMDLGSLEKAEKHLNESLKMAERSGNIRDLKFAEVAFGHYLVLKGKCRRAINLFLKYIDEENPYILSSAYYGLSNAYRKLKEIEKAEYFGKLDLETTRKTKNPLLISQSLINLGIISIEKNQLLKGEEYLKDGIRKAEESENSYEIARACLFLGIIKIRKGEEYKNYIEEAKRIILKNKFFFILKRDSSIIYPYLRKIKEEELINITEGYFVRKKLNIRTFGEFSVQLDGIDITKQLFKRKKTKAIFEFIVSKAPFSAKIDEILDVFFDSINTKSTRHNLFTHISMIRKAFEDMGLKDIILREGEGYRINLDLAEIDFLEFEKLSESSRDLEKIEKAISLYRDDFLKDMIYEDWAIPKREILTDKYISLLFNASEIVKGRDAIPYLKKILEKDPINDEAVLKLMKIYDKMGEYQRAIIVFKDYERMLMKEYGLSPTDEILNLYKRILNRYKAC